jgi:H+-transporting ATPase
MKNNTQQFPPPLDADKVRSLEADALLKYLKSGLNGLSSADAQARLAFYGLNTIQEKRKSALLKFLSYFWGPIAWMIEIAAILSAVVHNIDDLVIILILLFFNAIVGFWQEYQAGNAIEQLKRIWR